MRARNRIRVSIMIIVRVREEVRFRVDYRVMLECRTDSSKFLHVYDQFAKLSLSLTNLKNIFFKDANEDVTCALETNVGT